MPKSAYLGNDKYIFVSYAHKDSEKVYPFIEELQKHYNVWYDEGIKYGSEWTDEIVEKLNNCFVFIFCITNNSLNSENCKDEIHSARELGKNFINIMFDRNVNLPQNFTFRYGRYQMCNLFNFKTYGDAIKDLQKKCEWFKQMNNNDSQSDVSVSQVIPEENSTARIRNAKPGDIVKFGHYPQEGPNDPIEWIVIGEQQYFNTIRLVSKKILFGCEGGLWCDFEKAMIKFGQTAFTSGERFLMREFIIKNGRQFGNVITYVSMLEKDEVEKFFVFEEDRTAEVTSYAKKSGCKLPMFAKSMPWWVRQDELDESHPKEALCVNGNGKIKYESTKKIIGVRPVIDLQLRYI